ncbi:hypothetical protein BDZ89DRAFT_1111363 [Hymenopellis radicata]|nr:hypothetical protein BDZ89DRAFT_1111363 [Hymenopellis radicata]
MHQVEHTAVNGGRGRVPSCRLASSPVRIPRDSGYNRAVKAIEESALSNGSEGDEETPAVKIIVVVVGGSSEVKVGEGKEESGGSHLWAPDSRNVEFAPHAEGTTRSHVRKSGRNLSERGGKNGIRTYANIAPAGIEISETLETSTFARSYDNLRGSSLRALIHEIEIQISVAMRCGSAAEASPWKRGFSNGGWRQVACVTPSPVSQGAGPERQRKNKAKEISKLSVVVVEGQVGPITWSCLIRHLTSDHDLRHTVPRPGDDEDLKTIGADRGYNGGVMTRSVRVHTPEAVLISRVSRTFMLTLRRPGYCCNQ